MNILILGSGAREDIIREKLNCNVYVETLSKEETIEFITKNSIELGIPSSEQYLCEGYTDYEEIRTTRQSIWSKSYPEPIKANKNYSKTLMEKLKLPNPSYTFFQSKNQCFNYFNNYNVEQQNSIKIPGLAKGKGVYLPNENNINTCIDCVYNHGDDGVLIEERLHGTEVSIMAFCNGSQAYLMPQSQDFKNAMMTGLNTGGMGSICPVNILTPSEYKQVNDYMNKVVQTTNYVGILYAGLMKTNDNVQFLEFNCRFGDPEAQTLLNVLDGDLLTIMLDCINHKPVSWKNEYASCVIFAANESYPEFSLPKSNLTFNDTFDNNIKIYKGSLNENNETHGGRILSVVSNSKVSLYDSLINVYNNIHKIQFPQGYA